MALLDAFLEDGIENPPPPPIVSPPQAEIYFALRSDGSAGTGTAKDPYNGSDPATLDTILRNLTLIPQKSVLRFGPGLFRTRGFNLNAVNQGWELPSGARLVGAGTYSTTLQLVDLAPLGSQVATGAVLGSLGPTEDALISDLTLDANAWRQPRPSGVPTRIEAAGIRLLNGRNVTVRRVRVINWGTYSDWGHYSDTVPVPPDPPTQENFPLYISGGSIANDKKAENVVEECIIEQPALNPVRERTLINNHAWKDSLRILCTVRNCYLNGSFTTGTPPPALPVIDLKDDPTDSSKMILQTRWPHGLIVRNITNDTGDDVYITGSPVGALNARFPVKAVVDNFTIKFDKPSYSGTPFGPNVTAQRYVPRAMAIAPSNLSSTGLVAKVTTPFPHLRKPGEFVRIAGVLIGGNLDNSYNGSFAVLPSPAPTANDFYYGLNATAGTPDPGSEIWLDRWSSEAVMITNLQNGGTTTGQVTTGGPHYCAVGDYIRITGTYSGWSGYWKVTAVTKPKELAIQLSTPSPGTPDLAGSQIPLTTHGPSVASGYGAICRSNRSVDVSVGGPYHDLGVNDPQTEVWVIQETITWDNYWFYVLQGQFSAVNYISQRELLNLTERNIVELRPNPPGVQNQAPPVGLYFYSQSTPPAMPPFNGSNPSIFDTLVLKRNIIRFADDKTSPPNGGGHLESGIALNSARRIIVHNNMITMPNVLRPLFCYWTQNISFFNNIQSDGKLVQGLDQVGSTVSDPARHFVNELGNYADDLFWVWRSKGPFA